MVSPAFDEGFGFAEIIEDFTRQQLISELGVEALTVTILPWTCRRDIQRCDADVSEPFPQRDGDKLRSIVGPYMLWCTVPDEQLAKYIQNIPRVQAPLDTYRETLTRMLVDDAQHAEDLSIVGAILNEVIGPDMALVRRPEPHARSIIQPQPPALRLLLRDFQPFTAPYAIDALLIHMPAVSPQQFSDPAIAISAELSGQPDDRFCQRRLVTAR